MERSSYQEKRKDRRITVRLPLDYWEKQDVVQGGLAADISEGGLCLHSIHRVEIGAELKLRIYLSKDEYRFDYIEGYGKIIWRSPHQEPDWKGYKYGLYLSDMAAADREKVKQLFKELPAEISEETPTDPSSKGKAPLHICPVS